MQITRLKTYVYFFREIGDSFDSCGNVEAGRHDAHSHAILKLPIWSVKVAIGRTETLS